MSEQFIYQSVFAPYFKDFLAMKENQVSDIGRIKWMLLEFDKFFVNSNIRDVFITKSMIDTWKCTRIHDKKKTLYDKVSMFRQFCLYLCHIGKTVGTWTPCHRGFSFYHVCGCTSMYQSCF